MEVKKSPKADLEKGKTMGILMGMIVGLAVLFVGFEWSDREITIVQDQGVADIIAEEEVEITRPEDTPPPPPPPPAPAVAEVLTVVEDDVKLDDVEIVSSEDDAASAQVEAYTPPAVVEEEEESSQQIFTVVETMPEFPGGQGALLQYLAKSIKYPVIAQENGIQGRVVLSFVIEKDGRLTNIQVLQTPDRSLSEEAIRVLNKSPKWSPGKQRNQVVRVKYTLPVDFRVHN